MATAQGRIATWYVVKYVARTSSAAKTPDRRFSSLIFSTVIPARAGTQLSSSVSTDTTSNTSRFGPIASDAVTFCFPLTNWPKSAGNLAEPIHQLLTGDPVEAPQHGGPPARAKDDDFIAGARRGRPFLLVRLDSTKKVEPAVAPFDRT